MYRMTKSWPWLASVTRNSELSLIRGNSLCGRADRTLPVDLLFPPIALSCCGLSRIVFIPKITPGGNFIAMFFLSLLEHTIRIPPQTLNAPLLESVVGELQKLFLDKVVPRTCFMQMAHWRHPVSSIADLET
eukprot:Gb_15021 [translate_table: standard]